MLLDEYQWQLVCHLFPSPVSTGGRPPMAPRRILTGILWKLSTASPWQRIPPEFASGKACYSYYVRWKQDRTLRKVISILLKDVRSRGDFDYESACLSGRVVFIFVHDHHDIFLHESIACTWQAATAMLYFRRVAQVFDNHRGHPHPLDPLTSLYQ